MFSGTLLHLLHLCDPALPIGGFAHAAGLETYVQQGLVLNRDTAEQFVRQQLSENIQYTDAALVSLAHDAAATNDLPAILNLDEWCTAVKLPAEMRMASQKLGIRLLKIFTADAKHYLACEYVDSIKLKQATGHFCIAFGLLAASLNVAKADALAGFYYNAAAGFVTNSVKLIPLGQQDGQEILQSVFGLISELVTLSLSPDKSRIGQCCPGFDLRCMQHETLYSRLYMS